jgi:hypothetical protein
VENIGRCLTTLRGLALQGRSREAFLALLLGG